jgi:RND family efflux transporter MFP subunit
MKKGNTRFVPLLTGIALIAVGLGGAFYYLSTKPKAERRRPMSSMVPVVETMQLSASGQALKIDCLGTVIADKTAAIQAEVSGRIIAVNPALVEGELVKKGDVLVEIEDADYQLALLKAEANLLTAQSNLRIEEGQQEVVRNELEMMGEAPSDDYRDLVLREPQLKSTGAAVKGAELAVESAKLNLERTKIRAPYDAVIVSTDADVGDYAQTSRAMLELAATDRYFIRASIPLSSLEALPRIGNTAYPAEITLSNGTTRPAQTHRLLPDLSEKGRMARILLSVESPYASGSGRPLLLGEFVRVRIAGETVENATLLPRKFLRDGDVIWTIDSEGKLHILPVEILQGYTDEVLIRIAGDSKLEIVTTDLSAAVEGMQLRRVGEPARKQPKDGKSQGT